MREILFRGKSRYTGEWLEGYFGMKVVGVPYIQWLEYDDKYHEEVVEECAVILDTVGQYTGLKDKNGLTKIFEYDIIDANGRKVGNYYENSNLLKGGTCFLVAKMGTKEWSRSEQEAIKRGCKYAE